MTNTIKAGLLLLFVLIAPACIGEGEEYQRYPMCDVQPLASTYIVDCGDGTGVCRDARGDVMYKNCTLQAGPETVICVESCN